MINSSGILIVESINYSSAFFCVKWKYIFLLISIPKQYPVTQLLKVWDIFNALGMTKTCYVFSSLIFFSLPQQNPFSTRFYFIKSSNCWIRNYFEINLQSKKFAKEISTQWNGSRIYKQIFMALLVWKLLKLWDFFFCRSPSFYIPEVGIKIAPFFSTLIL